MVVKISRKLYEVIKSVVRCSKGDRQTVETVIIYLTDHAVFPVLSLQQNR
jgi:hypothetical protein